MNASMAAPAALLLALAWLTLGYWLTLHRMGDDVVSARLDALSGEATGDVRRVPSADHYARFLTRNYSGDRGPCPQARTRYASLYDELVARLGDPLGGSHA
jgi:predicted component of type VI protein secretion system